MIVDLNERPPRIYDLNHSGRVPVLQEDGLVLAESRVLMEYLEERFPEPPLLPTDPAARALVRLQLERFDELLGDPYYLLRRERSSQSAREALDVALDHLESLTGQQPFLSGEAYGLADCAYVPWLLRAEAILDVEVRSRSSLAAWLDRVQRRPAVAAELALVAAAV